MHPTYEIRSRPLILDNAGKRYVLTIRDLPDTERPREKMLAHGPALLSPSELLCVVLGHGTVKEDVKTMTERVVREYGEKSIFAQSDARAMARDLDLPLTKALQIIAVGELGRRFFERKKNGSAVIRTARDAYEHVADMRMLPKEHLRGLYLNAHYQLIHDEIISIGTVDANIVHPREVFRPALSSSAVAVVLAHNHPSGVLAPSEEDRIVTQQIYAAGKLIGIEVVDHIVVTDQGYISIPLEAP